MRYKVKVKTDAEFGPVAAAAAAHTKVFVISEGRRTLSTGDLSKAAMDQLRRLGAKIVPDMQYDADRSAA